MRHIQYIFLFVVLVLSCNSSNKSKENKANGMHEVVVQEVLHVSEYSYIRVLENGVENWLAAPTTPVEVGSTYYYDKFMEMKDFESKELNKTFETIYFLERISFIYYS